MTLATRALSHGTLPALVFDAPLHADGADVLDLRALDTPQSDVEIRNELRRRWRERPRLVVRIDDEPTPRIEALLFELVRREVRLTADDVDRFSDAHSVVVRVTCKAPPPRLARMFSIRVRHDDDAAPSKPAAPPARKPAAKPAAKPVAPPRRTDARRR